MTTETEYQNLVAQLRNRPELPPLRPEHVWHPGLDAEIARLSPLSEWIGTRADSAASGQALMAVLYLWNDNLELAHQLVQDLATSTGSALHGIMHRREGDYDNAKYWFRRAGDHPAWHGLQSRASEWLKDLAAKGGLPAGAAGEALRSITTQGIWNPYLFTDAVAMITSGAGQDESVSLLEELQQQELAAFLRYLESRLM